MTHFPLVYKNYSHIDFNLISPSLGTCTEVWQKYPRHLLDHSLVIIDIAFFFENVQANHKKNSLETKAFYKIQIFINSITVEVKYFMELNKTWTSPLSHCGMQ